MEYVVANKAEDIAFALAQAHNATRFAEATAGTKIHAAKTSYAGTGSYRAPTATALTITASNASSLATSRTLAQNIYDVLFIHLADAAAHSAADTTNALTVARPSDAATLAEIYAFLNNAKAKYEAHRVQSGIHATDDSTNTISASNATDQSSTNTLANELKTDINAHMADALGGYGIRVV